MFVCGSVGRSFCSWLLRPSIRNLSCDRIQAYNSFLVGQRTKALTANQEPDGPTDGRTDTLSYRVALRERRTHAHTHARTHTYQYRQAERAWSFEVRISLIILLQANDSAIYIVVLNNITNKDAAKDKSVCNLDLVKTRARLKQHMSLLE